MPPENDKLTTPEVCTIIAGIVLSLAKVMGPYQVRSMASYLDELGDETVLSPAERSGFKFIASCLAPPKPDTPIPTEAERRRAELRLITGGKGTATDVSLRRDAPP